MKQLAFLLTVLMLLSIMIGCRGSELPSQNTETAIPSADTTDDTDTSIHQPIPKEDPDMISHWSFDNLGEAQTVADSANRKHGVARGCTIVEDGILGNSLLIQPSCGGCVSFGTQISDAMSQTGAFTVAFWYYPTTSILQKADLFCLWMEDGKPGVVAELSSTGLTVSCRSHVKESVRTKTYAFKGWGEWSHLALSVDYGKQEIHLYRNGVEITAAEGNANIKFGKDVYTPGKPLYEDTLGGFSGNYLNTKVFAGKLDEAYLYSKAASAEEIAALYQAGKNATSRSEQDANLFSKLSIFTSMGNVAIACDSNVVLYNGDRCYLVVGDATVKTLVRNGICYAPLDFYQTYLNKSFSEAELTSLDSFEENEHCYLSVPSFSAATQIPYRMTENGSVLIGRQSTNADIALVSFIDRYYNGDLELLPVPELDVASTRQAVAYSDVATNSISLGSPSIVRLSNGNLLVSFDYNGKKYKPVGSGTNDAGICLSSDGGVTWTKIATVPKMLWGTLFCLEDTVYLMGRDTATGKLAIVKSTDFGYTWTDTAQGQIDNSVGSAHRAPTPAVICNGRIYLACEDSCDGYGNAAGVQSKRAYMMSAPIHADLLQASSWTKSNMLPFDNAWLNTSGFYGGSNTGLGFYEGNAVLGKDGHMYIILRIDADPSYGIACLLKLSSDNTTLTFERILSLPVGKDKFAIRYDQTTKKYIAIGNPKTTDWFASQRNVLAMYVSDDLISWTYVATLISDNSLAMEEVLMQNYGYQYPDFIIDGEDLLLAVREASGNTTYYHNANYISYYTVKGFRALLP